MEKSIGMSSPPCWVCGSTAVTEHSIHSDRRKGVKGTWRYMICEGCGLLFVEPLPSAQQLNSYYQAYYQTDGGDQVIAAGVGRGTRFPMLRKLYHYLSGDVDPRDFVTVRPGDRVLDYGSGSGTYLQYFRAQGANISGAEISQRMAEQCRRVGFDVRDVTDINTIPFPDGEFDIVYLMQVFEHVRDAHRFLGELHRVLKREGRLYMALPNGRSVWRTMLKNNWVSGWFAPFHLNVYNAQVLRILAEEHGFVVSRIWSRTPESWFRLNLAAALAGDGKIVSANGYLLGTPIIRYPLMIVLRTLEALVVEKDCLVMRLEKRSDAKR